MESWMTVGTEINAVTTCVIHSSQLLLVVAFIALPVVTRLVGSCKVKYLIMNDLLTTLLITNCMHLVN